MIRPQSIPLSFASQAKAKPTTSPKSLPNPDPHAVTVVLPETPKTREESPGPISQRSGTKTIPSDHSLCRRVHTSPEKLNGSSKQGVARFWQPDRGHETAPALDLTEIRQPKARHSTAGANLKDKVIEENLCGAQQDADTNQPLQQAFSPKMWPLTDRENKLRIEPLNPVEDISNVKHQGISRILTPDDKQQEEATTTLRPHRSLLSLKLVPKHGSLCIPPGSALSQSSKACAQGEVSGPPYEAETQKQPTPDQGEQKHEDASVRKQVPPTTEDGKGSPAPVPQEVISNNAASSYTDSLSTSNDKKPRFIGRPAKDEMNQGISCLNGSYKILESMPANELKEQWQPGPVPVPVTEQSSGSETVQKLDIEASMDNLPSTKGEEPTSVNTLPSSSPLVQETALLQQPPQRPLTTSHIPTITVQEVIESGELSRPLKSSETKGNAVCEPVSEPRTHDFYRPHPVLARPHAQLEAVVPGTPISVVPSAEVVSEFSDIEHQSAASPLLGRSEGQVEADYPSFPKLAIRKARNVAGSKLVLSILLGRQIAEQTKPQLEELARPSLWRPARTASVNGPCQVDGIT